MIKLVKLQLDKITLFTKVVSALLVFGQPIYSQQTKKPKLVVGIVIDQMRAEYLYRFQDNYSESGFKRLQREGFTVKNMHYNYLPTATGPGHASIYTGTTPANHGIVSNNWYRRKLKREVYCAEDSTVFLVDNAGIRKGKKFKNFSRSPKKVKTTTITDELKLFSNERSKVIGISIKDRGAIFPAGHLADGAYWYNTNNGNFITSSYYCNKLPKWLILFNNQKKADSLLKLQWDYFLPIKNYINSGPDLATFEKIFNGRKQPTFPYNLKKLRKNNGEYKLLGEVPFGNTILTELAQAAIKGEELGKRNETDFFTISYSSTDYIGHHFGIRSKELEDTYIRMDKEITTLLKFLDTEVGKENYILFLTADHAASDTPPFLQSKNISAKFYNSKTIKEKLNSHLSSKFGEGSYVLYMDKTQVYLKQSDSNKLLKEAVKFMKTIEGVKEVIAPSLKNESFQQKLKGNFVKNSYNSTASGDLIYYMERGWMEKRAFGTTHGNPYVNDTHVPLIWYGYNIPKGESVSFYNITQIAPTISMLLNIPLPSASSKIVIEELFD